jgi:hypothetical protein
MYSILEKENLIKYQFLSSERDTTIKNFILIIFIYRDTFYSVSKLLEMVHLIKYIYLLANKYSLLNIFLYILHIQRHISYCFILE